MKKLSKKLNLAPTASLFLKVVIVAGLVGLWVYAFFFAPSGNPDRIENGEWIEKAEWSKVTKAIHQQVRAKKRILDEQNFELLILMRSWEFLSVSRVERFF